MTRIRRINVSQVEGGGADNTDINEIRPNGETAFYIDNNNKLTMMMFDGVRTHLKSKVLSPGVVFGSNADAGDGSGADTIKLIPDANLHYNDGNYGNNQHIVVDPTGPNHIHLRAGGTIDNSNVELYLGGEQTFVRVSDNTDDVVIRTSYVGEGITPYTWLFDNTGKTTFPGGMAITGIGATVQANTGNNINIETNDLQTVSANCAIAVGSEFVADTEFNDDITVVQLGWTVTIDSATYVVTTIDTTVAHQYRITAAGAAFVQGTTYTFTNPTPVTKTWSFGSTGILTTPGLGTVSHLNNDLKVEVTGTDVIVLRTAGGDTVMNADGSLTVADITFSTGTIAVPQDSSLNINMAFQHGPGLITPTTFSISPESIALPTGNGTIFSGTGEWSLDTTNKVFRFPHNDHIQYDTNGAGLEVFTYTDPVKITAGQTKSWTFGTDGNLTTPGDINIPQQKSLSITNALQLTSGVRGITSEVDGMLFVNNRLSILTNWIQGNGNQKTWQFNNNGTTTFPVGAVPTHSYGAPGDALGMVAFDSNYIYYCTAYYTPNTTNVTTLASSGSTVWVSSADYAGDLVANFTANPTGWTYNGVTINSVTADNAFGPGYALVGATGFSTVNGTAYALVGPVTTDIWKRVAWGAGTW